MSHPAVLGFPRRAARHAHRSLPGGAKAGIAGFIATIRVWVVRHRGREALRELAERGDQHLLADIGVTREEALRRAGKWFWQG